MTSHPHQSRQTHDPGRDRIDWALAEHKSALEDLTRQVETVSLAAQEIARTFREGGKLLVFGNGGSAADAQHLAAEFTGRFRVERQGLPAIALTGNSSNVTALANDFGYERVFQRQVEALGKPGDVAVGISTSGRSPSVILALHTARSTGLYTIGFTAAGESPLADAVDLCLRAGNGTPRAQEMHILAIHIICDLVDEILFSSKT